MYRLKFILCVFFAATFAVVSESQILIPNTDCTIKIIETKKDTIIGIANDKCVFFFNKFDKDGVWQIFSDQDTSALLFNAVVKNGKFINTVYSNEPGFSEKYFHYDSVGCYLYSMYHYYHYVEDDFCFTSYYSYVFNGTVCFYDQFGKLEIILIIVDHKIRIKMDYRNSKLDIQFYNKHGKVKKNNRFTMRKYCDFQGWTTQQPNSK